MEIDMPTPIWLDSNILMKIDNGTLPSGIAEITGLQMNGYEILITPSVETEFLLPPGSRFTGADIARRKALLKRLKIGIDTRVSEVPMEQTRAWFEAGLDQGLKKPGDAQLIAHVRASAQARGIRNPVLLTLDAKDMNAMRRMGVYAERFGSKISAHVTGRPPLVPRASVGSGSFSQATKAAIKAGIKAGLKDALSAENIVPDVLLGVADRFAAREAVGKIKDKFAQEGFAKGVAAGVMGWTEQEVASNLLNRVTEVRIEKLEDPGGILSRPTIFKLAQAQENYAVAVGYQFAFSKTNQWKADMRGKGFTVLVNHGYHFPNDPAVLFEYNFIDKLAWVLRPTTDSILKH
jgi:hypothetical protein